MSSESEKERNGKRHALVIKQLYCDKIAAGVMSHVHQITYYAWRGRLRARSFLQSGFKQIKP